MKKVELIEAVAAKAGLTKADAGKAFDATFEVIKSELAKGNGVAVAGFGTFKVSKRAARTGRNPQTGAEVKIPARKAASFKAGTALKDALN